MALSLLSPLSALAVGPKTAIITWTDNTKSTFDKVKLALTQLVTLKFYDPNCDLQLTTDASSEDISSFSNPPQLHNGYYIDMSIPGNPRPILSLSLSTSFRPYSLITPPRHSCHISIATHPFRLTTHA